MHYLNCCNICDCILHKNAVLKEGLAYQTSGTIIRPNIRPNTFGDNFIVFGYNRMFGIWQNIRHLAKHPVKIGDFSQSGRIQPMAINAAAAAVVGHPDDEQTSTVRVIVTACSFTK